MFFLFLCAGITIIIHVSGNRKTKNPQYQKYIEEYEKIVNKKILEATRENQEPNAYKLEYRSNITGGTTSNFEGPQVHLKAIKFHDEIITSNTDPRILHLDGVSAHFDPDHKYFGLPDVKISIDGVRLYEMEKGPLSRFISYGTGNKPKPYKTYKKTIINDSTGQNSKYFVMQLWLTEFNVTVDIRPDRDIPVNISREEKNNTRYPGYWYGSSKPFLPLKDLGKEFKDFRYGDLSFILEIIPDNSPIYMKSKDGSTAKADFAIGAIYCKKAKISNEPGIQRISSNIHAGQPVFLNHEFDFSRMNNNLHGLSTNLEVNAEKLLQVKANDKNFIWNKPYYIKLFFNNLGTWRNGMFNQNQYHDQVSYSFLMPVFAVGSWDIFVPNDILPEWNPPEPYTKKFTIKNLLSLWKMGTFGKIGSIIILLFIAIFLAIIILPGLPGLLKKLIKHS